MYEIIEIVSADFLLKCAKQIGFLKVQSWTLQVGIRTPWGTEFIVLRCS